MIVVKVKAILDLAAILGGREQVIPLPEGSRLNDILQALAKKYGQPFKDYLYANHEAEELRPELQLLLNGRNIFFLNGLKTELNEGDELFFLSPLGGG